jgi:hypothetical protein
MTGLVTPIFEVISERIVDDESSAPTSFLLWLAFC